MNYISKATVAPVVEQGAQYDWEYAGINEEEEAMEAIPLPDEFVRDEAHARADRPQLHGWSKVADMKARLRELNEPVYGDKHTLWTRLKKAESALNARRAKLSKSPGLCGEAGCTTTSTSRRTRT